mgnify:CR=1 FL=1
MSDIVIALRNWLQIEKDVSAKTRLKIAADTIEALQQRCKELERHTEVLRGGERGNLELIAQLEDALKAFMAYPGIKEYVGSIVFNKGMDALALKARQSDSESQETSQYSPTPVSPHIE